jgi:hypothetical protein
LRTVGVRITPPLTMAETPVMSCSGLTEMPCPKAIVIVLISRHGLGSIGAPTSGSSTGEAFSMPMRPRNSRWRSRPTSSAILTAPILDE